jgi:predicted ATP-grasp superfamily ATP-dependent carboligase
MKLPGRYPNGFLDLIDFAPPGPWMYTGGLENRPWLVERMAQRRPLWGNDCAALLKARDPEFLRASARIAGLPAPECHWFFRRPPRNKRWLVKPRWGVGGGGIHFWTGADAADRQSLLVYVQEFIEGESQSAVFFGDGDRAWLLGVTRQLVGERFLHAAPFHYCGSVGPLAPEPSQQKALELLGRALASRCDLRGLFGVDGIVRDGAFHPVELNPRYTASMEVLEYAAGLRPLSWHRCAFDPKAKDPAPPRVVAEVGCVGKAVLFAARNLVFPEDGPWKAVLRSPPALTELPAFADIPYPGTHIRSGRPVLTFFARAATPEACVEELKRVAADLDRLLFPGAIGSSSISS